MKAGLNFWSDPVFFFSLGIVFSTGQRIVGGRMNSPHTEPSAHSDLLLLLFRPRLNPLVQLFRRLQTHLYCTVGPL